MDRFLNGLCNQPMVTFTCFTQEAVYYIAIASFVAGYVLSKFIPVIAIKVREKYGIR